MDELIPDDDLDPQIQGEDYAREEALKAIIKDYYLRKYPHLREPYGPWLGATEGERP